MNTETPSWQSLHIFLSDPQKSEEFLIDSLANRVAELRKENCISAWFFIRYWEGGPHLRFRFLTDDTALVGRLQDELTDSVQSWMADEPPAKETFYANHNLDGQSVDKSQLPWFDEGSVEAIAYEPELQRYGGSAVMAANESLFNRSSELALGLIKATSDARQTRLTVAFSLMLHTVSVLTRDVKMLRDFFGGYASYWAQYSAANQALAEQKLAATDDNRGQIRAVASVLFSANDAGQSAPTEAWRRNVQALLTELNNAYQQQRLISPMTNQVVADTTEYQGAAMHILSSHMHMLNNRLGLTPAHELVLSIELYKALDALMKQQEVSDEHAVTA